MNGRRIALLFGYAFASFIVPTLILLALNNLRDQIVTSWIMNNLLVTFVVILVYGFGQLYLWFLMGSWAAAVQPTTAEKVPIRELKQRLLSLNDDRLPFELVQHPTKNRITARWKIVDEKWIEIFAASGLKIQYEFRLKFVEGKAIVLAQDYFRRFEYTGGVGMKGVRFAYQFSFFKGISFFQYERGAQYGVLIKDGRLQIDYAYNYKFSFSEVKNPIIEILTGSGWEFRPVVFL